MFISRMAMFYELDGRLKHEVKAKILSLPISEFGFCWLFASLDSPMNSNYAIDFFFHLDF